MLIIKLQSHITIGQIMQWESLGAKHVTKNSNHFIETIDSKVLNLVNKANIK